MADARSDVRRVLYICGWGRSGTTILDRLLGQLPGFVSAGELRSLWDVDFDTHRCSCGEKVFDCPIWGHVLFTITSQYPSYTTKTVRSMRDDESRTRNILKLHKLAKQKSLEYPSITDYGDILSLLYSSLLDVSGAQVVVDSSKHPADALLLAGRDDVELWVLHVVRDPRAVAYSWHKRSPKVQTNVGDNGTINHDEKDRPPERGTVSSSLWWSIWNGVVLTTLKPLLGARFASLRYEDIMNTPFRELNAFVQKVGGNLDDLHLDPVGGSLAVTLLPSHTVAGNPNRHQLGSVQLKVDSEWQSRMSKSDRLLATIPALPLLRTFNYPILRFTRD